MFFYSIHRKLNLLQNLSQKLNMTTFSGLFRKKEKENTYFPPNHRTGFTVLNPYFAEGCIELVEQISFLKGNRIN